MKRSISRFITLVLFFSLILNLMPVSVNAVIALPYGMTSSSISVGSGSTLASSTTQIGFGGQRWYVVGFNGTGINKGTGYITLLAKGSMGSSGFQTTGTNTYSGSTIQTFVNALPNSYASGEQGIMVGLTLDEVSGTQPTNQKIWLLGYTEASTVSADVRDLADGAWWLRTPSAYYNPRTVSVGIVNDYGPPSNQACVVRPGTTLNLSNVLYAAPISGAKGATVGSMNSVSLSSEIKFTILNSGLGLTIPSAPASLSKAKGSTINLDFSGAQTGTGKYVSCVLVSQTDSLVKYYAKLSTAASGTLSIPISADVQAGNYTLLIYNEQISSGDSSDYASTPVSVSLSVTGVNTAPTLKSGVPSTANASVSVNSAYTLNLSNIFTDVDANALSYRVYINGSGTAVAADANYSFTPEVAGITTLRFTAYDGAAESASYTVTLTASNVLATSITVTAENGATKIGRNAQIQLYYTFQPSNTTNKAITWTTSFTSAGSLADGDIDAANILRTNNITSNGSITVRATAQDGSSVYGSLTLGFLSNIVTDITVNAANTDIAVGDTTQMSKVVSPSNANQSVTWSISSGSGIASISATGLLSLSGSGSVTVRATAIDGSGIYGEKILTVKGLQTAPSAPTLSSKTNSSVTLNTITGAEYSMDGTVWQSNSTFTGLSPNTTYSFYARKAGTSTLKASPASPALSVTTDKAILGGSISITGTLAYDQELIVNTSGLTANPDCALGTISYIWKRDGSNISGATNSSYRLVADDLSKVINVTVSTENCNGSISSGNATATVKSNPVYIAPTGLTASYGATLQDVSLLHGFSWEDPVTTSVGAIGSNSFTVKYTPDNATCYNIITGISVSITVSKATPSITTKPTASAITYGQALSDSILSSGVGSVPGNFTWTTGTTKPSVSDSNTTAYSVTFTPTDTTNYNATTTTVNLTINKATPSITTKPTASEIMFGQSLADSTLSGGVGSISGSFAWTTGTTKPAVSDSNTTDYSVTFTPIDTANYNQTTTTIKLTVSTDTPVITTNPTASAITYGQSLTNSTLSGGVADVEGSFAWTTGTTKPSVSDSNTTEYSVTFTPIDTEHYKAITILVKLTINKAASSITSAPTASAITYGQSLSDSVLSGGIGSVAGSFVWTTGATKPAVSDSDTTMYSVTFTPTSSNYTTSTTTVTLKVNKATPSITTVPTASAITYGQALSDSILSSGVGSVAGSFAWTSGPTKPSVSDSNSTEYSVTFTPTDTANYNEVTTTVKLIVNKAPSSITTAPTASAITYGQSLSDSVLSGGVGSVAGSFAWTTGAAKPAVSDSDTTTYSVTFTPTSGNYATSTTTVTLKVNKATPSITTVPTASAITYGQSLSDSILSGGVGSIAGSFAWTTGTTKPSVSDSNTTEYSVTFTPTDTDNYITAATTVKLVVNKAASSITTVPTASAITYGQSLSDSVLLSGVGSVAGSFSWTTGTTKPVVSDSDMTTYSVTFTPASGNYATSTTTVTLKVNKATPSITTAPTASTITYGQSLSDSILSGGVGSIAGSFAWTTGTTKPSVSDSNNTEYSVAFTPTDTANYITIATTVKLIVNKAATSVTTKPTASTITYGQTLSDSVLSGGVGSVVGSFAWTNGATKPAVSDSDTTAYLVTFSPTDTANYNEATTTVKLIVNKAASSITTAPTASAITYGQSLSDSVLSGGVGSVAGSFAWTTGATKPAVSDSDTTTYSVTFTPTSSNYTTSTTTVTLKVNKATPSITTAPTASAITYGQALSDSILSSGVGSVAGSFAWTSGTTKPSVSDSNSTEYSVTFTPTNTANYNEATTTVKLIVNKAASSITTAPTASAITYGQSLSDSVLSGGVGSVAGSFAWTTGATKPAVSDSDTTTYSVTFTPTSGNYATSTTTVTLKVNKATPSITTVPTASAITYGQSLSDSILSGGVGSITGSFAWTTGTTKPSVSDSNTTEYSVTFTPTDIDNYITAATTVKLVVNKATSSITTVPTASAITYGQSLSDSVLLSGVGSVAGSFAWTTGTTKPVVSDSDTTTYSVTFTPASGNYATSTTTVTLKVNKATPSITTAPTASTITYGQSLSDSILSGGVGSIAGSFAWTTGTTKPSVSDSDTTEYSVTFTPTDTTNYLTTTTTVKLIVNGAATSVTTKPTASTITYGQSLSDSVLSGGVGSVSGSFAWTTGTTNPFVSDSDTTAYSVTFTPNSDNYATSTTTVTLMVNKATPTITTVPTASAIIYEQSLADSILSGGVGSVAGSFVWTTGTTKPAVSDSNITEYSVTFTPMDTANYITTTANITLTVNKAATTITTKPTALAIDYEQSLANCTLYGGTGNVPGSFAWTTGSINPAVSDSNTTGYSVTFTPVSGNYATSTTTITLTVNKATPSITTNPTASAITYGQSLSDSVLSGGVAHVAGSFAWTTETTKPALSDSDITEYSVTFTPTNIGNYNTKTMTVKIKVNPSSLENKDVEIIINGETMTGGKSETVTDSDGKTTTTVTLDEDILDDMLASEGSGGTVEIPVTGGSDESVGVLTGEMIKNMENKEATLVLQTDTVTYTLPASEIDIDAVSEQLGTDLSLSDIMVTVDISEPSDETIIVVENAVEEGGFSIVAPAIDFTISCTYGDKMVEINRFNVYVERLIAIPEGVDPFKITTCIVVNPDMTTNHVPTQIVMINGKYYAKINSLTNSTYLVIWNPIEFADVENHWAKNAINDMGSRMIVSGVGDNAFVPDRNMTRAEFAAVIIRALGLAPETGISSFSDVFSTDWYCGYIKMASNYDIVTGYGDGTFGPNDTITREQAMVMIARAMKITGLMVNLSDSDIAGLIGGYADGASTSDYAKDSIAACLQASIVSGKGGHTIAPKDYITRAEVAVMVQRLLQKSGLI